MCVGARRTKERRYFELIGEHGRALCRPSFARQEADGRRRPTTFCDTSPVPEVEPPGSRTVARGVRHVTAGAPWQRRGSMGADGEVPTTSDVVCERASHTR